jgi:golgin subfamily B member 1
MVEWGDERRMSPEVVDPEPPLPAPPGEDWAARVEELLGQAEVAAPGSERAQVLCRVAEIYERRLGDPNGALVTLQAALEEDPSSGRVIQEMERVARGNGFWSQLVAVTAEVASGLGDRKQAADLWVQIAFWNESGLALLDEAAKAAVAALELEPAHGGALMLLEELYRRQRNWDRYVEILARKREQLGTDADKLADAYREVLRYEPRHPGALEGLGRVHEDAGEWEAAAEDFRRLIAALPPETPAADRVNAQHRLAVILKERLGDLRGAEEQLALTLAGSGGETHVPSLLLLAMLYRERKDWMKARQLLGRAAAVVTDVDERVRLLSEAAEICATALDDEVQAADLYAEIVALDGTRIDLTERLAEIKFRRGDFAGLLPLAERLVAVADARSAADRVRLWHRLGRAREATGDDAGAGDAYRAALAAEDASEKPAAPPSEPTGVSPSGVSPTGVSPSGVSPSGVSPAALHVLRDLAALSFRQEAWSEAAAATERLLGAAPALLSRDEQRAALERLGVSRLRAGEPALAVEPLEKALALDPRRRNVLETLVAAARAAGNDDAVVRHTQTLLAVTEDPKTKLELLEHLATVHRDRRNDPQRAIAAYMEALKIWPDERSIMHRLLELLTETKQWKQSVQLLARLAELAEGPLRAPYYVAAGNIFAEELRAPSEAVEAFERALDADPNDLKSFEQIDRLVTEAHDWKTQERTYRRQIKRMGSEVAADRRPVMLALWQGLGEIYRTRLKDFSAAAAAFEVAAGLDPDSIDRRKVLAELYRLTGPEAYPKAVAEHRAIIERAPGVAEMVPELKTLLRLFVEMGTLDEAHGAAAALVLIGQADADERALYLQYRPNGVVRARARLTEEVWLKQIYHPDQDRTLSQILATLSPAVASARAQTLKDLGLKRKHRRDVATDQSMPCKVLAYGDAVFGASTPEVYAAPDTPGEIEVVNLRAAVAGTPALVLCRGVFEARSDIELAFIVGRTLATLRPDHLLRWPAFVPTLAELEIAVQAAIQLVNPESVVPPESAAVVRQYAAFLERTLQPQLREQLSVLVRRLGAGGMDDAAGIGRWARAACFTSIRAGLLLAGDLEIAARLGQTAATAAGIDPSEVMRDLIAWSVSDGYFELRAQLGLRTVNLDFRG